MKIVSFNIRCVYTGDGENGFIHRKAGIAAKIHAEQPDVICFQEVTSQIAADLKAMLPDYTLLFNQRGANYDGEGLAFALRDETVSLVTLDSFWLSETPYVAGSRYEHQSDCPRICQTAVIKGKDGAVFRVSNNHLDHIDDEARVLGIRQVLAYMAAQSEIYPMPHFILGDFNARPDSVVLVCCKEAGLVDLSAESGGTFHNFGRCDPVKIDYIFTDADTAARPFVLDKWTDCKDGVYLSDHYPLSVTLEL